MSTKSHPKMSTKCHPKGGLLVDKSVYEMSPKVSTRCHLFCPGDVTYYVHEMTATLNNQERYYMEPWGVKSSCIESWCWLFEMRIPTNRGGIVKRGSYRKPHARRNLWCCDATHQTAVATTIWENELSHSVLNILHFSQRYDKGVDFLHFCTKCIEIS